jgi:hypothetical protein
MLSQKGSPENRVPEWVLVVSKRFGPEVGTERRGDLNCFFASFGYALIAAISGWMPMMFITLVRL